MGKDTVAEMFCDLIGRDNALIYRMSKTLKEAVQVLYGYTHEDVEGPTKETVDPRYGMTPRQEIQGLCDYLMQRHGQNFFSKQVFYAYDNNAFGGKHVVIPDIRYEHDLQEIRQRGGIIIKIARPYSVGVPFHPWEAHIDCLEGDYHIMNHGSHDDLREKVSHIFNQIVRNNVPLLPCLVKPQPHELVPLSSSEK